MRRNNYICTCVSLEIYLPPEIISIFPMSFIVEESRRLYEKDLEDEKTCIMVIL